jgi:hypothetical protein
MIVAYPSTFNPSVALTVEEPGDSEFASESA